MVLWRLLKLHVKEQGVPLILDVEAGAEVWNYPVYPLLPVVSTLERPLPGEFDALHGRRRGFSRVFRVHSRESRLSSSVSR